MSFRGECPTSRTRATGSLPRGARVRCAPDTGKYARAPEDACSDGPYFALQHPIESVLIALVMPQLLSWTVNDGIDQRAKKVYSLEQIRIGLIGLIDISRTRQVQLGRMRDVADTVHVSVFKFGRALRHGQIAQ